MTFLTRAGLIVRELDNVRILIVSSAVSPYNLVGSYLRSMRCLGHTPLSVSLIPGTLSRGEAYLHPVWRLVLKVGGRFLGSLFNARLRRAAVYFQPDIVFVIRGEKLQSETIAFMRSKCNTVFLWFDPDSIFHPLGRRTEILACLPLHDVLLTWNRSFIGPLHSLSGRPVEYLPFAADPEIHYPVNLSDSERQHWQADVMFAGKATPDRSPYLVAAANAGRLALYGALGETELRHKLKPFYRGKWVYGEDYARAVAGAKICLNILFEANYGAHNMRTFEVPACGGFLLTMRSEGQEEFFMEGSEMACYGSTDELQDKVRYYLAREDERKAIAQKAYTKVQSHTYMHRVRELVRIAQRAPR